MIIPIVNRLLLLDIKMGLSIYVFFASYRTGKSYIFKTNDNEDGLWIRNEINGMYHDDSLLLDDKGKNYLVWKWRNKN
jgi:hypothetical protein